MTYYLYGMDNIETNKLWEEKNLIEPEKNCLPLNVTGLNDTTNDTKNVSTQNQCNDIGKTKICTQCKIEKSLDCFSPSKIYKCGYRCECKLCNAKKSREYKKKLGKEELSKRANKYYHLNIEKSRERQRTNWHKHKAQHQQRRIKWKRNWSINNKEKIAISNKKTYRKNKNKRKTDIKFQLRQKLRCRLNQAIRGNSKKGSAVKDLGCTIPEFKKYMESKFQEGMTWENWSKHGWHIDHIKPLVSFDLTNQEQFLEAVHYTNLQPLWAKDNLSKHDRIIS